MVLKDTIKIMSSQVEQICKDLKKVLKGNKAASQRVRTVSIKFSKTAKEFRKESIAQEKKKPTKAIKKTQVSKKIKRKTNK